MSTTNMGHYSNPDVDDVQKLEEFYIGVANAHSQSIITPYLSPYSPSSSE